MKSVQIPLDMMSVFLSLCMLASTALYTVTSAQTSSKKPQEYSEVQKKLLEIGVTPKKPQEESTRERLKRYQKRLKELAYYASSIDGIVGPKTRAGLLAFQRDVNLSLTGTFDQQTVASLFKETLILNTQDFPPFHYTIQAFKDRVYGPIPEMIRVVCLEAELNCMLRLYDWGQAQELVKQGNAHGMFVIGWNAARAKFLRRSLPIIETEYGFFVREDDPLTYTQIADLRDYTIGVFGPSNTSRTLRRIENAVRAKGMKIHIKETRDDKPLFRELAAGSGVRAVFSNKDVGNTILNGLGLTNIKYAGPYKTLLYYVGFSQKLVSAATVAKFDAAFRKLRRDGVVQEIYANSGILGSFGQEETSPKKIAAQSPVTQPKPLEPKYTMQSLDGAEVVVDKTTCLMWQRHGSETPINWNTAQQYIDTLNSQKFASYADWRLPKTQEVRSLMEQAIQKKNRLYIDPIFDALQQTCWSDDGTQTTDSSERQFVDFYEGSLASSNHLDTNFVRAVRGTWCQERS